jgi:hypothetical protein
MVGGPGHQLADPDHQQWSPHDAQIYAAGAERGIDAATAPNGGSRSWSGVRAITLRDREGWRRRALVRAV